MKNLFSPNIGNKGRLVRGLGGRALLVGAGFGVLRSAAREMLLNITARSARGAVTLPTLSFIALVTKARKQKADSQKKTSPAATA
jgi:hypothetical protein